MGDSLSHDRVNRMRASYHRLSHFFVLLVIVSLATIPGWFAQADVVEDSPIQTNLKPTGSTTDTEAVLREGEAMNYNGYSAAEKQLMEHGSKYQFQAEVSRLMGLIVNSLYSNREVFIRELLSNASDALDKIRFISLTDPSALETKSELEIRVQADGDNHLLHIIDTGVGMTKEDMINNLGTIAKSGTSEFMKKAENGDTSSLIGQFGVGFYSAFLVADRVTVTSKHNDDKQHIWTSDSNGEFVVGEDPEGDTLGRGTRITLHLKSEAGRYADPSVIKSLCERYSEFMNFPIYVQTSHEEEREIAKEPDTFEEGEEEADDWDNVETITETVWEWELVNDVKPLWTRDSSEISDEDYIKFFKDALARNSEAEDPYSWVHFKAEGDLEFNALLYLPREVPHNMFDSARANDNRGVRLYVRRVYITDEFDTVIPKWLSFIKGIVDSSTLPLNVSREILQQDHTMGLMQKKLIRKAIAMIQKLAIDKPEEYMDFYNDFRVNLKLGVLEDRSNQERLAKLLRFQSSKSGKDFISLEEYVERMKEGQEKIYYLAGENRAQLSKSPLLEKLVAQDYEVLYFTDSIDEYWSQTFNTFDSHKLVNIGKDVDLDLGDDAEEETFDEEEFQPLVDFCKSNLKPKVNKVVLSKRLTTTPSALISTAYSYSANMERIQRAQALGAGLDPFMTAKRVLEINPTHPLVQKIRDLVVENPDNQVAVDMAQLLYDTAALHSGFALDDPSIFAQSIHRMMSIGLDRSDRLSETLGTEQADAEEEEADEVEHDEL